MDERLEKALEFSNYMVTLNNQKTLLQEQFKESCVYYYNGGKFFVTRELISFIQCLKSTEQTEAVLVDDNELPIFVEDLDEFATNLFSTYFQATNKYLVEYNKIKKNRSVKGLVDL
jgi:hypothetical protein